MSGYVLRHHNSAPSSVLFHDIADRCRKTYRTQPALSLGRVESPPGHHSRRCRGAPGCPGGRRLQSVAAVERARNRKRPTSASPPSNPTKCGKPTSPTTGPPDPTAQPAPAWRSSPFSTTVPATPSPSPAIAESPDPSWWRPSDKPSPTAETFWAIITPYMRCLLGLTAGTGAIVDEALALRFVKGAVRQSAVAARRGGRHDWSHSGHSRPRG